MPDFPPPPSLTFSSDSGGLSPRPLTPSTTSTFSLTGSMENRVFRDDEGRKYQATNDEYSLPADDVELERLDVQHRSFKAMQGDKNYLAPMDQALRHKEGEDRRVLDVGTGTGIWAIEIAKEFPHVEVIGIDLAPVQYEHDIPINCHFAHEDAARGLSYPDGYFDVVHARALVAGIRDWAFLVNEMVRVTKPGGLVVFMDTFGTPGLAEGPRESHAAIAPGFVASTECGEKAMKTRGMDFRAVELIVPRLLEDHAQTRDVQVKPMQVPMTPWSDDPLWNRVGKVMLNDTKKMPDTARMLVLNTGVMSSADYDEIKVGYMRDLFENKVHAVLSMGHVWAWKV